jgi:hypothetical protein
MPPKYASISMYVATYSLWAQLALMLLLACFLEVQADDDGLVRIIGDDRLVRRLDDDGLVRIIGDDRLVRRLDDDGLVRIIGDEALVRIMLLEMMCRMMVHNSS